MRRTRSKSAAFTLLELVAVMIIACIMMAAAAASLSKFSRGARFRDAVTDALYTARFARMQAVTNGTVCRFEVAADGHSYTLSILDGQAFVPLTNDLGRGASLPDDGHVELRRLDNTGARYIEFYPNGRTEPAILRLVGGQGQDVRIGCLSTTELFRVLSDEEARQ